LIIAAKSADEIAERITNAGSVFIGNYSCEAGRATTLRARITTLPTSGYARSYSGVSVDSFVKKITFQN
jgi:histidinol dehydrogenase